MRISVLIATFNRSEVLARTLSTLAVQRFPADQYEIIVVDDGSTDDTPAFLRSLKTPCSFRALAQENKGQAAARNAALKVSSGKLVLFLDDDMLCDPDLISAHANAHGSSEEILGIGSVIWEETHILAAACVREELQGFYNRLRDDRLDMPRDAWVPPNSSLSRDLALRLGGFDESFVKAREDTDFGLRLWTSGVKTVPLPAARCNHLYVKSNHQLAVQDAQVFGRNDVLLARKYPEFRQALPLAHIRSGSAVKKWIRFAFACCIFCPEPLLRPPCWLASQFEVFPCVRALAMRLLRTRRGIVWIRSALREAGCWKALWSLAGEPHKSISFPGLVS